jgi:HlyD family secretion protein
MKTVLRDPIQVASPHTRSAGPVIADLHSAKQNTPIRKWRKPVLFGLTALVLFLGVRSMWPSSHAQHLTATATKGEFDVVVVETGDLQAERSRAVPAPVMTTGGRSQLAIQFLAPEGTHADSGALLITFDPADQLKTIGDKANDLKAAQADLEKMKAQQKTDKEEAEVAYENSKLGYQLALLADSAARFESEQARRELKLKLKQAELAYHQAEKNLSSKSQVRKSDMAALSLKIAQIQSTLDRATADGEKLQVHAPASGLIVYQQNWSTGKKFVRGDQCWGGQPVIMLPDLSHMQAALEVNEVDISKVKAGQTADVRLDAFPDRKFTGKIKNVASIGNPKESNPSVKVFEVLVDLEQTDSILRPGMTVSARIHVSAIPNVVSVPLEAVFDDEGKPVVYVEHGSSFDKRAVTLGEKNDNFVIVTKGVAAGEKVSLTDPNATPEADMMQKKSPEGAKKA